MRIFAGGVATETNSFSPVPTSYEDFLVHRGSDDPNKRSQAPSFDLPTLWGTRAAAGGHDFRFSVMAFAQPAGKTVRGAYEHLRDELLDDLRVAMPVDVVLLMLHGAMIAEGYDDCERDIIERVRAIVGTTAIIGVEFDLHCTLDEASIRSADIVVIYKHYPHHDINERAAELFELALAAARHEVVPRMALFDCRMVGLFPTSHSPLKEFVEAMQTAERRAGVLSVSLAHGFPFADLPNPGAKMLVVADGDSDLAAAVAAEFGDQV